MVKVRGQSSNRNGQTDGRKWPKNHGWRWCGQYYVTGARRQDFKAAEWSWIQPGVRGFLRQVAYEVTKWFRLIMNILHRSRDLAWLRSGTTDVTSALTCQFFRCLLNLLVRISTSDISHRILRGKNLSDQSLMILKCSFPLKAPWKSKAVSFTWRNTP